MLNRLSLPKGAKRRRKRVGRGCGSGRGKTSGRGSKGLLSRSGGKLRQGFEGGQMPLLRRIPKRGFTGRADNVYQVVNVGSLNSVKSKDAVSPGDLAECGLTKRSSGPVKILGDGDLKKALTVRSHAFSASARTKIEKAGGKAEIIKAERGRKPKNKNKRNKRKG